VKPPCGSCEGKRSVPRQRAVLRRPPCVQGAHSALTAGRAGIVTAVAGLFSHTWSGLGHDETFTQTCMAELVDPTALAQDTAVMGVFEKSHEAPG
jgi:hypothetical protein